MRRFATYVIAVCAAVAAQASIEGERERVELSAPLLPGHATILWRIEGASYPTDEAARVRAVDEGVYSFAYLLNECAPHYSDITLPAAGAALTNEQLAKNYNAVARCAYERFTSKPYWIPQLVDDVDVCAQKLGVGWRLPTERDLASLTREELQYVQDTLTAIAPGQDSWWGTAFFSTDVYVRGDDGSLRRGTLVPDAAPRVTELVVPDRTLHFEGHVGVRCIRRTIIEAQ